MSTIDEERHCNVIKVSRVKIRKEVKWLDVYNILATPRGVMRGFILNILKSQFPMKPGCDV